MACRRRQIVVGLPGGFPRFDAADSVVVDPDGPDANSGRRGYDQAHIPGAVFVDLLGELSDPAGDEGLPPGVHAYRLPPPEDVAEVLRRYGITHGTTVVVYDTTAGVWAARLCGCCG